MDEKKISRLAKETTTFIIDKLCEYSFTRQEAAVFMVSLFTSYFQQDNLKEEAFEKLLQMMGETFKETNNGY